MVKTKRKRKLPARRRVAAELEASQKLESVYFLKLLFFLIIGSQWLSFVAPSGETRIPLPVGMIIGLLFAMHEKFKIDRKIEYAVLLVSMLIGFGLNMGIFVHLV